jgi:hypothetical protein
MCRSPHRPSALGDLLRREYPLPVAESAFIGFVVLALSLINERPLAALARRVSIYALHELGIPP